MNKTIKASEWRQWQWTLSYIAAVVTLLGVSALMEIFA